MFYFYIFLYKILIDFCFQILEKYCGYGFLADREGNPILMSLLGNLDVEGKFFLRINDQKKII